MVMGRRKNERRGEMWVASPGLPWSAWTYLYEQLNRLLAEIGIDAWVEKLCGACYARTGRPGIPPGLDFRMLLIGYFKGIGSQWRFPGDVPTACRCGSFWGWGRPKKLLITFR